MADLHAPIEDLVARLERERLQADRLYNDALTAVDRTVQPAPNWPPVPPGYDAGRIADLNLSWDILPPGTVPGTLPGDRKGGSLKDRLRAFVWRLLGPPLQTQKQFNAALADHVNRNAEAHRQRAIVLQALVESTRLQGEGLARFQSLLVQYLQTITLYVDSRDRAIGGSELRERVALNEQRLLALARLVETSGQGPRPQADVVRDGGPLSQSTEVSGLESGTTGSAAITANLPAAVRPDPAPSDGAAAFTGAIDSLTYVAFEDRFRGTEADIARRVEDYLPILDQASDVVDVGCGRGELLAALTARGISARGIDISPAMVAIAVGKGLNAVESDALSYLERQTAGSIGGLVAIQVVEHFTPGYLTRFLAAAYRAMRTGSPLILETINPACWMAFFETYLRDVTHQHPLHADTLKLLVQAAGFSQADVQFRQPVPEAQRLDRVAPAPAGHAELEGLTAAINAHADKLNARLFSSMDYVVVARR